MNEILASHPERFKSMIEKFQEDTGNRIGMLVEELREFFLGDDYSVKVDSQFSLDIMPLMAEKLSLILYRMDWLFGEATDKHKFLTCDTRYSIATLNVAQSRFPVRAYSTKM